MTDDAILQVLRNQILAILPELDPAEISLTRTLSELGLNSIDRTEVIILSMEELGLAIPVHEFRRGDTLAGIIAVLRRYT
ncbi:MAG: phosphopantetheine-binding protein [Myxococcales bacterium]|nr:phosphopantetheine-binding protein [Myxococcales bacterium]